jgi:RNA recognition motif-containing protein
MRSRGFGFVTYASEESVEAVFATSTLYELDGRTVEVSSLY